MRKPALFVSSTCYDLKQVRTDLKSFAESLGLEPLLSEYDSFPVNPDLGTADNCLSVVNTKADLFLLIVGGRYGSTTADDKSVTNLEYLAARSKGIPVYAFVLRSILDTLPVWKDNRSGNFNAVADSPKLFEFVESLRDSGAAWVFPFDTAQSIFAVLRTQLAYLFMDALELRLRAHKADALSAKYRNYSGTVFRLIVERPPAWEYLLFSTALEERITSLADQKRDWIYGIAHGPSVHKTPREFPKWMHGKLSEASRIGENAGRVIREVLPAALGPPGVGGDPEAILHAANRLSAAYGSALEWKLDFYRLDLHPEFDKVRAISSSFCDNMVAEIETFSHSLNSAIEKAETDRKAGRPATVGLTLTLTIPKVLDQLEEELGRVSAMIKAGEIDLD